MDILIPDGWLREHLDTKAKPQQIANLLSLCGPSIEKVDKVSGDYIYHVHLRGAQNVILIRLYQILADLALKQFLKIFP